MIKSTDKRDYILHHEFKGGYAIAEYKVKNKEEDEVETYVGIIDENLNEVVEFYFQEEEWRVHCSNLRIEDGELTQDEERYYHVEEIYRYIKDGIYLSLKEKKLINLNDYKLTFPKNVDVIDFNNHLNLLVIKSSSGYGLGDTDGNIIIEPIYGEYFYKFHDYIEIGNTINGDRKYGLADFNGNIIVKPQFEKFIDLRKTENGSIIITAISTEKRAASPEKKDKFNKRFISNDYWSDNLITEKIAVLSTIIIKDNWCKSINYLPINCEYSELDSYWDFNSIGTYVVDECISSTKHCLSKDVISNFGKYGVCDIYGNTVIPYKYANQILPVKVNNKYYFIWVISGFFGDADFGLVDENNDEVLKCEFSKLYTLNGELYGEKDKTPYKIHLDPLRLEKISELPKTPKEEDEDTEIYNNDKEEKMKLISLENVDIKVEHYDDYICFSSNKKEKKYNAKDYNYTIEKIELSNGEYIFLPLIDYSDWNSKAIILNKDLEEVLNVDIFTNDISIKTNIANTNCFEIVEDFWSPNEDALPSCRYSYIYDENFNLIDELKDYKRVNLNEVLSNGRILNLKTKETRDYYIEVKATSNKENKPSMVKYSSIGGVDFSPVEDEDNEYDLKENKLSMSDTDLIPIDDGDMPF